MATLGAIIDRILTNVGKSDVGENREAILADLLDLLRVDVFRAIGGGRAQGIVPLTLGATAAFRPDGVYSFPPLLRSFSSALQLVDDPGMPTPSTQSIDPHYVFSDPLAFYSRYRFGPVLSDSEYSKPTVFLVMGNQVHARPIPNQSAVAAPWWGTLALAGTVYPDLSITGEDTECPVVAAEPYLVAQGTQMQAARAGRDDVMNLYGPISTRRLAELSDVGMSAWSRTAPSKGF